MGKDGEQPIGSADTVTPDNALRLQETVAVAGARDPVDTPLAVKQLGRYLVLGRIGAGGMGVVYRAFDPQLDRKVAIKLLRAGGSSNEARARLLREAQAMARLSHPNVIAVHDVGMLDDQVFIAMELIEGDTLGRWLNAERRDWRAVLAKFLQAGRGLAAAHAAGLVHRDFKPDNVLVDERGRVCVTDFGLARSADEELAPEAGSIDLLSLNILTTPLTRTGALLGTPAYMAPEQLRREPTSPRTDQFSFCVALYEGIYGERPFVGETISELARNLDEGKLREPPPNSRVPKWLRAVLLRGLRRDPDGRFPSMDALLVDLERDPGAALRRRLIVAGLLAVAALVVVAARGVHRRETQLCRGAEAKLSGIWDDARRTALAAAFTRTATPYAADAARGSSAALDDYARRWATMRVSACEATRVHGEQSEELLDLRMACLDERRESLSALVNLLLHADATMVGRAVSAAQRLPDLDACQDVAALKSPVRLPADPAVRARIDDVRKQIAVARALTEAGRYADGARAATAAVTAAEALGHRPLQAEALYGAGYAETANADFKSAERHFIDAALAADAGHDDAMTALAWSRLVLLVGFDEARYDEGLAWARYARAGLERIGGNPRIEAMLLTSVGTIYAEQGRPELAQPEHERALALQEKLLGPDSTEVATTLLHLGYDHFARGQWDLALAAYQRSLDIREKALGPAHPLCATALINVGNVYYQRRDLDRAADDYARALAIQERALGADHAALANSLNNLGNVYSDQKKWDRASAAYRRALAIDEHALGPEHPSLAAPIENLGDVYLGQGRTDLALAQYQRGLLLLTKARGADHPSLARPLSKVGDSYLQAGARGKAVAPLERALALWLAHSSDPLELAQTRFSLARALADSDRRRARALVVAARATFAAAGASRQAETAAADAWLLRYPAGD